jgi:hypothetical protein
MNELKKIKLFSLKFLAIAIFMSCCVPKEYNEIAKKTAIFLNAESYTTSISNTVDSRKGTGTVLVVSFKNISNTKNYSHEKVTSLSAYRIISEMKKEDYSKFSMLKIVIENDNEKYEQAYEISKLVTILPLIQSAMSFFSLNDKEDFIALRKIMSEAEIPDTTIQGALRISKQINLEYGKPGSIDVIGFSFNKVAETNEPLLIVWVEEKYKNDQMINYVFYVSEKSKKILYFGIDV